MSVPTEKQQLRSRQITTAEINRLEEAWRDNPSATLQDLEQQGVEEEIQESERVYEDGYHYQNIIAPLVNLEAEYDRKLKENQKQEGITVRWEVGFGGRKMAVFRFPNRDEQELRILVGDELRLSLDRTSARQVLQYSTFCTDFGAVWACQSEIQLTFFFYWLGL